MMKTEIMMIVYLLSGLWMGAIFANSHDASHDGPLRNAVAGEYFKPLEMGSLPSDGRIDFAWEVRERYLIAQDAHFWSMPKEGGAWVKCGEAPRISRDTTHWTEHDGILYVMTDAQLHSWTYQSEDVTKKKMLYPSELKSIYTLAASGEHLYVIGENNEGEHSGLKLNLSVNGKWKKIPKLASAPTAHVNLFDHGGDLYIFSTPEGTEDSELYRLEKAGWRFINAPHFRLSELTFGNVGPAHVICLEKGSKLIRAFYSTTEQWVELGYLSNKWNGSPVIFSNDSFSLFKKTAVTKYEAKLPPTRYGWLDHLVVACFMIGMLWIGKRISQKGDSEEDYFRGGQRIPWWAAGLSLFATGASAISLMAQPAKAYSENWVYFSLGVFELFLLPLALYVMLPIARRLQVATAFEYLQLRFCFQIRLLGSFIYSANQILARMASIMLLPSIALSAVCGIPMETSIVIMGVVTTLYATMGGLEAVIWTDVIQAFVMLLAMLLCAGWIIMSLDSTFSESWLLLEQNNKLQLSVNTWEWTEPVIYIIFINAFLNTCARIGDQNFIQRVQSTPDEATAKKAIIMQLVVAVPLNGCLFALGTCLYLYYHDHAGMISPALKADGIFPLFAAQNLPSGLAGVVVAALMAATMSTLSSAINSVANLGVEDFVRPFKPDLKDKQAMMLGKIFTFILGLSGIVFALILAKSNLASIWDLALMLTGMVYAPMVGIFLLGIFTKRANTAGVAAGVVLSIILSVWMKENLSPHIFFYFPVSVFACFIGGYVMSIVVPCRAVSLEGLTVYSLPKEVVNDSTAQ